MIQRRVRVTRWGLAGLAAVTAAAVTGLSSPAALAAAPAVAQKTVTYLGYTFTIPSGWPVIRTTLASTTCVRFDQHALYLGDPGQNQRCPAGLLGTTEAILVQPAAGTSAAGASAAQDATARQITVVSPRVKVTATYASDPALVTQILASAALPLPSAGLQPAGHDTAGHESAGHESAGHESAGPESAANAAQQLVLPPAADALPVSSTSYTGPGFDACTAPSSAYMSAWMTSSPYRAVGVYIGGAERACAQPNLTASWVAQQAAAGWHFLPTYVGVQAEFGQITAPASQADAAAQDAATQAAALGFGPGTPIYYDMEAYPASQESNALAFLSAWTTELHAEGYKSGVYSSSSSGITDLADNFTSYAMPDVIWDALWNGAANTADSAIPAADWADNQRAHQYNGGVSQTYGGDTINVDQDYLDVNVTPPVPVDPGQSALVSSSGTVADYVIRSRNLYTYYQTSPGGSFAGPKKLTTTGNLTGVPVAVQAAGGAISVFADTTSGAVRAVTQSAVGGAATRSTSLAGHVTGSLGAIATQQGTVAAYAIGTDRNLYTYYQTSPGGSFAGPKKLTTTGNLSGTPVAAQTANGAISVFAKIAGGAVKTFVQSAAGGAVTKSASLADRMGSSPSAIVTGNGTVAVYVIGTNRQLYGYSQSKPGSTSFSGPVKLTANGGLTGIPVPILNANATVSVYAQTTGGTVRGKSQSAAGGPFNSSSSLGGDIAGDLAGVLGNGTLSLLATGTNGRQYGDHQSTTAGAFGGWAVI
jgi:hypothetical protein